MPFLTGYANLAKLFYFLQIVFAVTSSASSEDTPSTHRYKAKSAEFPPKCFRITSFCCSVAVVASRCRHVFSHLSFFFCNALLRCWWTVPLKWFLRETVSTNLVLRTWISNKSRELSFWYSVSVYLHCILLLSINKLSGISGCQLVYFRYIWYIVSVCPSSSLLLLLRRPQKTSKI